MFKNLKIGKKMMVCAGSILGLLLVISIWGIVGLGTVVDNGIEVSDGNNLRGELLQREVDHLNWAAKVSAFLTDSNIKELTVQLDHTKCGFGKWYYGEGKQEALELLPVLKGSMTAIETPHKNLHASAVKIQKVHSEADAELPAFLTQKELDHVAWTSKVQDAILTKQKKLSVQLDHTKCGFGKFVYGEAGRKMSESDSELAKLLKKIEAPHKELHGHGKTIDAQLADSNISGAIGVYQQNVLPVLKTVRGYLHEMEVRAQENMAGKAEAEAIFATETQQNLHGVQHHLKEMSKMAKENILSEAEMINSALSTRTVIIIISILALVIGSVLAYFITRAITGPVGRTVNMIEELEKGHLNSRLNMDSKDEIGQLAKTMDSFADSLQNEMVDALQKLAVNDLTFDVTPRDDQDVIRGALKKAGDDLNNIVSQINVSGEQVASASNEVSSASQSLSQGSTEQAASLEEITSSMTEMGAQTQTNSENANQANQLADQARTAADRGNQQMQEMVTAMAEINEAGQNISKIIKVIDEIAFQTNLLALNAAVEAARAGKHGKGFAVVAEEVRNLAARSAQAAKETAELIEGSVAKTENGSKIASHTSEALNEIVGGITKVSDLVAEINAASTEQAQGIAQISEGLGQIDQVTQQNTANAEESAAAAEELSGQATQLKGMLARFRLKNQQSTQYVQPAALSYNKMDDFGGGVPPQEEKTPVKSSDIIALDDGDFGKY